MVKNKKDKIKLALSKPIVFADVETTGVNTSQDRVVSIAVLKIMPDGKREEKYILMNPGRPIPEASTKIHGITNEMVKDKPPFSQYAKGMLEFFEGCDIGGFNCVRFDIPLLSEEFARCGMNFPDPNAKFIDVAVIYHKKQSRTLAAGYKFYVGKELEGAHNAQADINATVEIFLKQLEVYPELKDIDAVVDYCRVDNRVDLAGKILRDTEGDYIYSFGKHRGVKVKKEPSYAQWMLGGDFSINTKTVLRGILTEIGVQMPTYQ